LQDRLWEQYQENLKAGTIPMWRVEERNIELKKQLLEIQKKNKSIKDNGLDKPK